jgi:gamma-glutamyltranspeptidase / glutathione hydrolase
MKSFLAQSRISLAFVPLLLLVALCVRPSLAQKHLNGVVVSDHNWATRAGMEILEQGGNAVDAAVATAYALAVVDPASSGLGGGGFMVVYQAKEKKAHVLDFLEVSPAGANLEIYEKDGRLERERLVTGARAVAVPGTVGGLVEALKRSGSLPLDAVMAPAIRYAEFGFPVTARLQRAIEKNREALNGRPNFRRIFAKENGESYRVGETIRQPELAEALKLIARQGSAVFYQGTIGRAIAATVKNAGGILELADLKSYKPVWRQPVIGDYRGILVITVPPPSSGGIALIEMLNVLEGYALRQFPHNSATYLHVVAETLKAALADQRTHIGDPEFTEVPVQQLTSKEHATTLRKQISTARASQADGRTSNLYSRAKGGTSHLGVLDGDGNVVALSLTINDPFGAKILVREAGIILNNSMARFAIPANGSAIPKSRLTNGLEPRKRPLSTMTPAILLKGDEPVLVVGASGGSRITSAVLQTILNMVDFEMPLKEAIAARRLHVQDDEPFVVVERGLSETVVAAVEDKGHTVRRRDPLGVVQAIQIEGPAINGQSDPRLE